MPKECMLTTIDNPFDPFEQFIDWRMFDIEHGYNTSEYLARVAKLTDDMTQKEEIEEVERAVDEIMLNNPLPIYKKVYRSTEE